MRHNEEAKANRSYIGAKATRQTGQHQPGHRRIVSVPDSQGYRYVFEESGEVMAKKIKQSDLRKQADELIRSGQMPSLDRVLQAVAETRETFVPLILKAREKTK
jgi:hypothetical protein